jgi:hypothetical protein
LNKIYHNFFVTSLFDPTFKVFKRYTKFIQYNLFCFRVNV